MCESARFQSQEKAVHHFFFPVRSAVSIHSFGTPIPSRKSTTAFVCFPCTMTSSPAARPAIGDTEKAKTGGHEVPHIQSDTKGTYQRSPTHIARAACRRLYPT